MIHPILSLTYLIPFHLVAGSDLSKPGPTGLVAAFPPSRTSPVKTEVIFLPSVVHIFHFQCVFSVYILT